MRLFLRHVAFWSLTSALLGASGAAVMAQSAPETTAEAVTDLPEMAEIERAWARGDFVTVREGLRILAEQTGTPLAQYRYGRVLVEGRGGPVDLTAAALWLERAVAQDYPSAYTLLAQLYLSEAPGAPGRDPVKAAQLLESGATRGQAQAQYILGLLYQAGSGVEADPVTALNWLRAAAEQQYAEAMFALSGLLLAGPEALRDRDEGLRWLEAAASEGMTEAQFQLATLLDADTGETSRRHEALNWYRRAAESGNVIAQRILGTRYLQGDGVAVDAAEALRWLQSAAASGDAGAMANLGFAYASGTGVEADPVRAAEWYNRAAQRGLGRAMVALGSLLERGVGGEPDVDAAIALYLRALETDDSDLARLALGRSAITGQLDGKVAPQRMAPWVLAAARRDVPGAEDWLIAQANTEDTGAKAALARLWLDTAPDRTTEALALLEAAAMSGHGPSQFRLAEILARGDHGTSQDYVAAHKWYNIAATFGHPEAGDRRQVLGDLMTPAQVADAQKAARVYFENEVLTRPLSGNN